MKMYRVQSEKAATKSYAVYSASHIANQISEVEYDM
jgi:hypothetical protein